MKENEYISIVQLCQNYKVTESFLEELKDEGLIEFTYIKETRYVPSNKLARIERIIRLNRDLDINVKGIDVILNLSNRIKKMKDEISQIRNRLNIYE